MLFFYIYILIFIYSYECLDENHCVDADVWYPVDVIETLTVSWASKFKAMCSSEHSTDLLSNWFPVIKQAQVSLGGCFWTPSGNASWLLSLVQMSTFTVLQQVNESAEKQSWRHNGGYGANKERRQNITSLKNTKFISIKLNVMNKPFLSWL